MISRTYRARFAQRGVVLISSLLLLIVVTIMALSLFRSFGIQEKIAGNVREKQRALQAAVSAEVFAENWLSGNATAVSTSCAGLLNGNIGQGQICSNPLPTVISDVTAVPWQISSANVGVTFLPTNMVSNLSSTTATPTFNAGNASYFGTPTFYISDLGPSVDPTIPGEIYQIDAFAYGGNQNTVAVVESTYAVYTSSSNRTL